MKQFWIIWCPQGSKTPSHKHPTEELAIGEAERLARLHPDKEFFVMEAIHLRQVVDMRRVDMRPEIPF